MYDLCRGVSGASGGVTEGRATIALEGNTVFYNKAQVVNRDLSVAVLRWFVGAYNAAGPSKKNARVKPPKDAIYRRKVRGGNVSRDPGPFVLAAF